MHPAIIVLISFVAVTALLPAFYVSVYRTGLILSGKTAINSWTRSEEKWTNHAVIKRLQDAHMNCLENLPLYIGIVAAAYFTDQLAVIGSLAWVYLTLRVLQIAFHAAGTSKVLVMARATCYLPQLFLILYWAVLLIG